MESPGPGNHTFLVIINSDKMKLAQMYEFIAEGPQEKKQWEEAIKRAMTGQDGLLSTELPSSPVGTEFSGGKLPLGLSPLTSHLNPRGQLNKIDDDMKKLLMDKFNILRAMQGGVRDHRSTPKHVPAKELDTPKAIVEAAIKQAGEISSTIAHIMVPNPTKSIIAEAQARLTDIIRELDLEKHLSQLIMLVGDKGMNASVESFPSLELDLVTEEQESSDKASSTPTGDEQLPEYSSLYPVKKESDDLTKSETVEMDSGGGREASVSEDMINIPSPIPELDELIQNDTEDKISDDIEHLELPAARSKTSFDETSSGDEALTVVVVPPDSFLGDDSATPTPILDNESLDSCKNAPRFLESPSTDSLTGKSSPLVVAQYRSDDQIHRTDQGSPDTSTDQRIESESSRQPLSPLAKSFYSSQNTEQSAEMTKLGSRSKGLSIYPSSQHDCQPEQHSSTDEDDIVSYTLSRKSTNTSSSIESEVSPAAEPSTEHEHLGYEGTYL